MKLLSLIALLFVCVTAEAQSVRVTARGRISIALPGATASYTLDPDCADAQVDGGAVVITGIRPCDTHLIIVVGRETRDYQVFVLPSQMQMERMRVARLSELGIQESGSVGTFFSSDREEVETSVTMARTMGDHSTTLSLAVANGYDYSPAERRTVVPRASLEFKGNSATVTLLDGYVAEAPTTLQDTKIRGLHIESKHWFLHGGIASLTNFREYLLERDPDHALVAGYRMWFGKRSSLTTDLQWVSASSRYVSGKSGALGAMLYRFDVSSQLHFAAEMALGQGAGFGSSVEYAGDYDHVDGRVRSTSSGFASLSTAPARGLQSSGNWSHIFDQKISNEISGFKNRLLRLDGSEDGNTDLSDRIQWRHNRFTSSSGIAYTQFSHGGVTSFRSLTVPFSLNFETRCLGNAFQYQVGRTWTTSNQSQSIGDSLRITAKSLSFRIYAGRQTQAPSLDYILQNLPPWLTNALLSAGVSMSSPEDIQKFLTAHSDLISGFSVNTSPLRQYAGGSVQWSAFRNRLSARFESRIDEDTRITSHIVSFNHSLIFSGQFHRNQVVLAGSYFRTEIMGNMVKVPTVSIGIGRQITNVPDIMTRLQERGFVRGVVYADNQRAGTFLTGDRGIEGVLVVLDGTRRTRTNRFGWYSFNAVPSGMHIVEVQYRADEPFVFTSAPYIHTAADSTANFGIATRNIQLFGNVKSDAGRGIEGVGVHLSGVDEQRTITSPSGTFAFHLQTAGEVKVSLDPGSIPPGYALQELREQGVALDANHPGHADFALRALRSVSGRISCGDREIPWSEATLQWDHTVLEGAFDKNGNYVIRDLTYGVHDLVVTYRSREYHRGIDLGPEPNNMRLPDFDICTP